MRAKKRGGACSRAGLKKDSLVSNDLPDLLFTATIITIKARLIN